MRIVREGGFMPRRHPVTMAGLGVQGVHFVSSGHGRIVSTNRGDGIVFRVIGRKHAPICSIMPTIRRIAKVGRVFVSPSILMRRVTPNRNVHCATAMSTKRGLGSKRIMLHMAITTKSGTRYS